MKYGSYDMKYIITMTQQYSENNNLVLVRLHNVDDYQYPPQKKSFAALRFIVNHYSGEITTCGKLFVMLNIF